MSVELIRDHGTFPQYPADGDTNPVAVRDWSDRTADRIAELINSGDFITTGWHGWAGIFNLALCYGWVPRGPRKPSQPDWRGGYFEDGIHVSDDDARSMGRALQSALADAPCEDRPARIAVAVGSLWASKVGAEYGLDLVADADWRPLVEEYITFLERGSFRIS